MKKFITLLASLAILIVSTSCDCEQTTNGLRYKEGEYVTLPLVAVDGPGKYVKREKPAGRTRDGDPILCYSVYVQFPNGLVRQYTLKTGGMYTLYMKFQTDGGTIKVEGDYLRLGHQTFAPATISIPSPDNIY